MLTKLANTYDESAKPYATERVKLEFCADNALYSLHLEVYYG